MLFYFLENFFSLFFVSLLSTLFLRMFIQFFWLFILSALPLIESRLAIPYGILQFELGVWEVLIVSLFGNILSVGIVLWVLPFFANYFRKRSVWIDKVLTLLFEKTQKKHSQNVKLWGDLFLVLFVSVPLPGSGGWTAALVAFVFGFPFLRSFVLISLGLVIAGVLVAGITTGGQGIFSLLSDGNFNEFFLALFQ